MKTVLVTGANGFIGRQTLSLLFNKNFQVHGVYFASNPLLEHKNVIWHSVNLHEHAAVEKKVQEIKPSHLLHLAWYAKPVEYWTSPHNLTWLTSSINLLNAFIKAGGSRAVLAGSCAEYDWSHGYCQEYSTPSNPTSLYGGAKHSLYILSEIIAKQQQLSLAWGRLFFLFGPHEYPQRLIPSAITTLLQQLSFTVNNCSSVRDFMYVKDVAGAFVALLEADVRGPFNIASGQPVAISELINILADKLNVTSLVKYQQNNLTENNLLTADISRLKTEVKWQPQYLLTAALDETINWWREQL